MSTHRCGVALIGLSVVGLVLACDRRDPLSTRPSASRSSGAMLASRDAADDGEGDGDVCSIESLHGGYGFVRAGVSTAGPLAGVGLVTYDGTGNWSSTETLSRNGTFSFDAASSGTYTVTPDCAGKLFSGDVEVGRLSIADGGKTVFQLDETAQNQIAATEKRVPQNCSDATVDGDYAFYRTGTTSTGPLSSTGLAHYDGAGGGSAVQTNIRNGVINPDAALNPGVYELNGDCTGKLFFGGREIARVVVVDKGREIYQISEGAGNTVTGVQRRAN
ncbi:MAG TPA: hypothetical protein VL549_11885 [Gemmatimonadales bacterium]|jgi:hypothetical protein|nr:hypothetical protein [Gemmatimonadales bacterium]